MKISVVTVAYNAAATIEDTLRSVTEQDYPDLEYIVVDGASKDDTVSICKRYEHGIAQLISEPDQGIYDAMNKGIRMATGDFVGLLNSDDFYAHAGVISAVARQLQESDADTLFGDLIMVHPEDTTKVSRYYPGKGFELKRFEMGDMPPHPTFFVRRELYEQWGFFKPEYKIVADFELMLRFLYLQRASYTYLPEVMVHMRTGGNSGSGVRNTLRLNAEMKAALKANNVPTNTLKIYSKYFRKVGQLIRRPEKED